MCGRFTLTRIDDLEPFFELDERPQILPRYNIAPSQEIAVVRERSQGGRGLSLVRWGFAPARSASNLTINARCETIDRRPMFRDSFRRRRCLVPSDGFYEWKKTASGKQPFHIRLKDRRLFAFAGLWEPDRGVEGEPTQACAIVTTDSNPLVTPIHDRMPVMLSPEAFPLWLAADTPEAVLKALLKPFAAEKMEAVEVARLVNSPFNDSPECLSPPQTRPEFRQAKLF